MATAVDHVECAHDLEAGVRELRLLAAHAPPYNRRSKFPRRWWWIVLTDEAFPRFSIVRTPRGDSAVGPFRSRADAVETADLLARFTGLRTCTTRIARSAHHGPACPERELSPMPGASRHPGRRVCRGAATRGGTDRRRSRTTRCRRCSPASASWPKTTATRPPPGCATTPPPRSTCCGAVSGCARLRRSPNSSRRVLTATGGWHLAVIRCGQLASAGVARRGVPPMPVVDAISAGAQAILPVAAPLGGALVEEVGADHALAGAPGCAHRPGRTGLGVTGGVGRPMGILGRLGPVCAAGGRADPRRRRFRGSE